MLCVNINDYDKSGYGRSIRTKENLKHITDEKPITARQCVKALAQVGLARPQYIPQTLSALRSADLSKYNDSMRPLIERDMEETEKILMNSGFTEVISLNNIFSSERWIPKAG